MVELKIKEDSDTVTMFGRPPTCNYEECAAWVTADLSNHGDLLTPDEILAEIKRLRNCRRTFLRMGQHNWYTRYSNRIGVLLIIAKKMGIKVPKVAKISRKKRIIAAPKPTTYQMYRDWFINGKISREKFLRWTRKSGGIRPGNPDEQLEYERITSTIGILS